MTFPGPDLCSPRKIQSPTTGNEPTEILQAAQTTPHVLPTKKMQFSPANPNQSGHFQSRNPPSAVPHASQTISPPLKPPLSTLTAFWKYKPTVNSLSGSQTAALAEAEQVSHHGVWRWRCSCGCGRGTGLKTFLLSYSQAGCQNGADIRREMVIFRVSLSQT